jgi:hypothetical protein
MPWHCPACQTVVLHNELEDRPSAGVRYRCHVCRLELAVDIGTGRLTVAPMADDVDRARPTK